MPMNASVIDNRLIALRVVTGLGLLCQNLLAMHVMAIAVR